MKLHLLQASALFAVAATLYAQDAAPAAPATPTSSAAPKADLPSADSIMQRYIQVTGGKTAYDAVKTEVATGSFNIKAAGISGTIKMYQAAPAKGYAVVDIPGVGKMEEGTDGNIAWENSAIQGARIKTGDEAAAAIREGAMDAHTDWKKYYKSAEVTGTETIDGKTCYKVLMTPLKGAVETDYYDKDSGLLIKQSATYDTPMGKIPMEVIMSDYHKQGDFLLPFHMDQHMAGQQFETVLDKFDFNVDIPDSRFALPDAIKALQK
jgi:hypothetical protein